MPGATLAAEATQAEEDIINKGGVHHIGEANIRTRRPTTTTRSASSQDETIMSRKNLQTARLALLLLAMLTIVFWKSLALARTTCDGPKECCPSDLTHQSQPRGRVDLGLVLVGLYNVDERAGTWDADYYLTESWAAAPGFCPATEIVNELTRQSTQFDSTELRGGRCIRSRRIHSTLHTPYSLRTFPFDQQSLLLEVSDAEYSAQESKYSDRPVVADLDEEAKDQLSSWKLLGGVGYRHSPRVFKGDEGAPSYDYAIFSLPVRRHITYHLTKFFLPLLVIIVVAFSVFWIDPEDLGSKVGIGVTCLLAAIAFQLAEAGALPAVAYLTLADRVYAVCYTMLALALMASVWASSLVRRSLKSRAMKLDRISRLVFPAGMIVAIVAVSIRAFTQ
jgi:hypothetical protein